MWRQRLNSHEWPCNNHELSRQVVGNALDSLAKVAENCLGQQVRYAKEYDGIGTLLVAKDQISEVEVLSNHDPISSIRQLQNAFIIGTCQLLRNPLDIVVVRSQPVDDEARVFSSAMNLTMTIDQERSGRRHRPHSQHTRAQQ